MKKILIYSSIALAALSQGALAQSYKPSEGPATPTTNIVNVNTATGIASAIANALPGQVITIAPGTYTFNGNVNVTRNGTSTAKIYLRAAQRGTVTLNTNSLEGFVVKGSNWVFENLKIQGACSSPDTSCEHAVHIVGNADDVIFRYNEFINYSSHFKLNQLLDASGVQQFPDRLWIIKNKLYNTKTNNANVPHNPLNLDGGDNHIIRGNIIADFAAGLSSKAASGIYPKSGARYMTVEQNLVICKRYIANTNTVRGIYMGDGTMSTAWPKARPANIYGESVQNTFRNNITLNCTGDGSSAGIFVGDDSGSKILHNTSLNSKSLFDGPRLYTTTTSRQISATRIQRNVLNNGITMYGDASLKPAVISDNLALTNTSQTDLFAGPTQGNLGVKYLGSALSNRVSIDPGVQYDFCGNTRDATTDLGAIDYDNTNAQTCVARIRAMYDYKTFQL